MKILYLDLDTLRPDHMSCYGYHRNTTPHIDKIAEKGIRFNNYYCTDAPCLPSRSALMSGKFGIRNGAVNHGGIHADQSLEGEDRSFRQKYADTNLISIFRYAGLKTCTVSPFAERHSSFWFNASFNETYNNIGKCGNESAEEVYPDVVSWIDRNAEKDNWLLHINMWDSHTPYRVPAEYGNPFENEPLDNWMTDEIIKEHIKQPGPHTAQDISMYDDNVSPDYPRQPGRIDNMDDYRRLIDGYDTGIKYMDDYVGRILSDLEKKGVSIDDLNVIISSDHGENMGELGIYAEHGTADNITCRIPLIIKWVGGIEGATADGLHGNIDLCPTIAELTGIPPYEGWDGKSFAQTILNGIDCGRDSLVLSQCSHVCQRSVRFDNWLYIKTYHDGYHLFPKEMLFDLQNDPHEQYNLVSEQPDIVNKGAKLYLDWLDEMMASLNGKGDPMWQVIKEGGPFHAKCMPSEYPSRLIKTNRNEGAAELRQRHPGKF